MTTVRWRTLLGLVSVGFVSVAALLHPGSARADDNAAHSIADKFAHGSDGAIAPSNDKDRKALERKLDDDARLRADEAEMLERAKAEAADLKARKEQAERERAADAAREVEAKRLAAEKADAERRAAEEKRKAEEDIAEDKAARERAAKEALRIKEAEVLRLAAEKADVERREKEAAEAARVESARQADAQRRMEADREEEARRLSEKLTRAREQRAAKDLGEGYSALGNPPSPEPGAEAPREVTASPALPQAAAVPQPRVAAREADDIALAAQSETRATILLVMEPGTRGIRRYEKTADPILCIGERCYIGRGVEDAAQEMTRGRAFGPGNTLGQRAGACRHSLVCIFRDVEVGTGRFEIQPIDLRILRHDRREKVAVESDRTCTAASGHLHCSRGARTATYRAWIVPESVARKAGGSALSAAISSGLPAATADLQR